jgi:hypothetical protein
MGLMYSPRGGGNATVPNDAPILPAQAFVDNIAKFIGGGVTHSINISNQGITHLDGEMVMIGWAQDVESANAHFDLNASGNAIPTSDVDSLLAQFILSQIHTAVLNVSGGTSGLPTPNPAVKAAFTVGTSAHEGWFIENGTLNGKTFYQLDVNNDTSLSWHDGQWSLDDVDDGQVYFSNQDVAEPWNVTVWQTGTAAAPSSVTLRHPSNNLVTSQLTQNLRFISN